MAVAVKSENVVFTGKGFEVETSDSGVKTLWLKLAVGQSVHNPVDIMPAVQERIDSEKMPAGVLSKEVARIVLHVSQLEGALGTLFSTYDRMVGTTKKTSAAYKARYALLDSMSNKVLKMYAEDYIPDELDNYILSDSNERIALIERLCAVLVEEKENGEGEDSSAE